MKLRYLLLCMALVLLLTAPILTTAQAENECVLVTMLGGWARATVPGAPTGGAFGMLVNLGSEDDTLISASSAAAEAVEVHQMKMGDNDVMQMSPVEGGLVVPAQGYVELRPGSYHIMLINLVEPLVAGEMVEVTLTFENAGDVTLTLPILDMDAMDNGMGGDMEMGEGMEMHGDMHSGMNMEATPEMEMGG